MTDHDDRTHELLREHALALLALDDDPRSADRLCRESFVRLGGDSLRAMRLAARADELGMHLELRRVLGAEPLDQALAGAVEQVDAAPTAPAPGQAFAAPRVESSPAQEGIWIHEQHTASSLYSLAALCRVHGRLDPDRLRRAIEGAVRRHEGLRTIFVLANGRIERRVLGGCPLRLDRFVHDGPAAEFAEYAREGARRSSRLPFAMQTTPPVRFALLSHRDGGLHALTLNAHHIALDGWAMGLVLREIFERYDAVDPAAPYEEPAPTFIEYLDRQDALRAGGELERQAEYWRERLEGAATALEIPSDRMRAAALGPDGARLPVHLGTRLSAGLARYARKLDVTPAALVLAGFALTLSRFTGTESLLIGVPVAGRPTEALTGLVAHTVNLVPARIDVDDELTVAQYLTGVHAALAGALAHADLPFQDLVAASGQGGIVGRHPLVQAALGMTDAVLPSRLPSADLDVEVEEVHGGGAQFELELFVKQRGGRYHAELEYALDLWSPEEAAGFAAALTSALEQLIGDPAADLAEVRAMTDEGARRLRAINDTSSPLPLTSVDQTLREQAERTPHALALREGEIELDYAGLADAAAAQAARLAAAGVRPGDRVLIGVDRSIGEAVAALGALWAGAAYVGVAADLPARRLEQITALLRPSAVIGELPAAPRAVPRVAAWDPAAPGRGEPRLPPVPPDPDRAAVVLFTSGSTGTPKGCAIPHRAIQRLVCGLSAWAPVGADDRVLRFSPLSFDASLIELWGGLLNGASVEVCPAGLPSPRDLAAMVRGRGVSYALFVSGLYRLMADHAAADLGGLHTLITGGDVIAPEQTRRLLARHPGLTVVNIYGPSENTTLTTYFRLERPEQVQDRIPIGLPAPNTRVYVLDRRRRPVPFGAVGELYVAGDGLALGYLDDESETGRLFGRLSPDIPERLYRTGDIVRFDRLGRLDFLGRRDDQVKIRGFRVEPEEISAVLNAHPGIADALVTVTEDAADRQLIACCVPVGSGAVSVDELVAHVSASLPAYMVPQRWALFDELPLNANGKVDRAAVRAAARPAGMR